jgi:hypothetical protein
VPKNSQRQSLRPAGQERSTSASGGLDLLLSTLAGLEADRVGTRGLTGVSSDAGRVADGPLTGGPELLVALDELRALRDRLTRWEPVLIAAARDQGVTWTDLAPVLGVSSRQAAEARYLRLKHDDDTDGAKPDATSSATSSTTYGATSSASHGASDGATAPRQTREQRVRATRDRRSGDRAVAGWARENAAELRSLAGQIAALPAPDGQQPQSSAQASEPGHVQGDSRRRAPRRSLDDEASRPAGRVHQALGSDDVADLVGPLLDAASGLGTSHPELARRVADLAATAEQVRADDLARRRTGTSGPHT